jgi:peptidoglycan L-alanyl-D-glutamate endopeptidase CwlK
MTADELVAKHPTLLTGVHPLLVARVAVVLTGMELLGYPMTVTAGLRTVEQQQALYAAGRSLPGHIVTNDDGVTHRSNHQARASDNLGHAVDCAFVVNGQISWDDALPWGTYGRLGQLLGLAWGGGFASLVDRPHLELP